MGLLHAIMLKSPGFPFNQLVDTSGKMFWITNFIVYIDLIREE